MAVSRVVPGGSALRTGDIEDAEAPAGELVELGEVEAGV
jgi:hypothetical protein